MHFFFFTWADHSAFKDLKVWLLHPKHTGQQVCKNKQGHLTSSNKKSLDQTTSQFTTIAASATIPLPLVARVRSLLLILLIGALIVRLSLVVRMHCPLVTRVPSVVIPHRLRVVLPTTLTLVWAGLRTLVKGW